MAEDDAGYASPGNGSGAKRGTAVSAGAKGFDKAVDDEIPF
jgi:hypothetical protein